MASRAYSRKTTIQSCQSIDVLYWDRLSYFRYAPWFSWLKTRRGEPKAYVKIQHDSVILKYTGQAYGDQYIAIDWTPCRFGGERPWFVCSAPSNGVACGRKVAKLYMIARLFACRHCHRLAYESQQQSPHDRALEKARKIRMQLGGSANLFAKFPDKPKHMHWLTYHRLRCNYNIAEERAINGLMRPFGITF